MVGGLLLAVNVWIIAGVSQRTNSTPTLPNAIEELIPKPGDLVSPQSTIGVNLRNDLQGVLQLDGAEIPQDQVVEQPTRGHHHVRARAGQGPHQAAAGLAHAHRRLLAARRRREERASTSYTWSFKVGA